MMANSGILTVDVFQLGQKVELNIARGVQFTLDPRPFFPLPLQVRGQHTPLGSRKL